MEKLNDSSRAEFEAFMSDRFKDSIDRRRCKNGDGNDYMSWDMNVARAVWQHLSQRAEAAEARSKVLADDLLIEQTFHSETLEREDLLKAKLAELEKQAAAGTVWINCTTRGTEYEFRQSDSINIKNGQELFTRPAPAANLAELVPPVKDDSIPGKNDSYIDMCDGWNACRAAILRNIEELKK